MKRPMLLPCGTCDEDLYRCPDCRTWYCEQCEGLEHDRAHREREAERAAAHAAVDEEYER